MPAHLEILSKVLVDGSAAPCHIELVSKPQSPGATPVTFFKPGTDELDLASQAEYFAYLADTGLKGLVVLGTNAETFLLMREERKALS